MDAATSAVCTLTVCAWRLGRLSLRAVWWQYVLLGGAADLDTLSAYLGGLAPWPAQQHDILAQALNEHLWDLGLPSLAPLRGSPA